MNNEDIICRKLQYLVDYYQELKEDSASLNLSEYLANRHLRRVIERTLQLIVECATDINNMILKRLGQPASTDYFNSFLDLAEVNVLSLEFALQIAPSTGLRNIIVHDYQKLDDEIVFQSISLTLKYYGEYIKIINQYLNCLAERNI